MTHSESASSWRSSCRSVITCAVISFIPRACACCHPCTVLQFHPHSASAQELKAKSDQEAIRTKQSKSLLLGTILGTVKFRSTNLIPKGYNPSRLIPRTGPLGKIRTRKSSIIRVVTLSNPCEETIIDLGHIQPIKPGLYCLKRG